MVELTSEGRWLVEKYTDFINCLATRYYNQQHGRSTNYCRLISMSRDELARVIWNELGAFQNLEELRDWLSAPAEES